MSLLFMHEAFPIRAFMFVFFCIFLRVSNPWINNHWEPNLLLHLIRAEDIALCGILRLFLHTDLPAVLLLRCLRLLVFAVARLSKLNAWADLLRLWRQLTVFPLSILCQSHIA